MGVGRFEPSGKSRFALLHVGVEQSRRAWPQDPDLLLPRPSYGSDCALVGRRGCGPAVKAYYDRAAGVVRVESDRRVDATLYSLSGTPVVTQPIDGTATIDMTAYPSGVYPQIRN